MTPLLIDNIDEIASTAPAAPNKCPVIDLVEFIFIEYKCSPKTSYNAFDSATSPKGVEVPCMFTVSIFLRSTLASLRQFSMTLIAPIPSGCGAVIWCASAESPPPMSSA